MNEFLKHDPWRVIEQGFHPEHQRSSESIFSIGNGKFGQRANFEEKYSGDSHQGSYIAGVYYPDKTKVGWWKNGYPEYFAKVLNSVNWIGLLILIEGEELDLHSCEVKSFERVLDMKQGLLQRSFEVVTKNGHRLQVNAERFCSMANDEVAVLNYEIKALSDFKLTVESYLDSDVENEDTNWEERFWIHHQGEASPDMAHVLAATKKTDYYVACAMSNHYMISGSKENTIAKAKATNSFVSHVFESSLRKDETAILTKYIGLTNSLHHEKSDCVKAAKCAAESATKSGYKALKASHIEKWASIWKNGDIRIDGDVKAQQAIRFNIFHLNQTYTGEDERLNIGPKGFIGEKYGGSTYWDTEAYCLPFYLCTHPSKVSRQLLMYRYKQLDKAIDNARKLGFKNGAALYPMVTMTGEECHNEWEITFEEIHRNGAIAYAIYNYVKHTDDTEYLLEYGVDVLIGIARFWAQRVNWSSYKKGYVMLGVTGPNEYENNVNNNWYTNYIAKWCLTYTLKILLLSKETRPDTHAELKSRLTLTEQETKQWSDIIEKMYLPEDDILGVYLQQDGFLDKELIPVSELKDEDLPINQKWSWDRILRSVYIKQADTLQGLYFFEDHFGLETIRKNFDFYEPFTVHESSLSPCIHVVLAAKLGYEEKAYEMYLRTARLDLDDYNLEAHQGLHITSMAGTWLSVVEGFGGLRVKDGQLHFNTMLPKQWNSYSFKIMFRGRLLQVSVSKDGVGIEVLNGEPIQTVINGEEKEFGR